MRLPSHGGKVISLGGERGLGYKCHRCVFAPAKVACAMRDGSIVWHAGVCLGRRGVLVGRGIRGGSFVLLVAAAVGGGRQQLQHKSRASWAAAVLETV